MRKVIANLWLWLLLIGLPLESLAQKSSEPGPIQINKGETVEVKLRYIRPRVGAIPHGDSPEPSGRATISRDESSITIDIEIGNMPRNPGKYYLYLVRTDNTATKLGEFASSLKQRFVKQELDAFRLV